MSRISARRAARRAARQAPAAEPRTRASYEQLEGRTLLSVSQDADGFTVVGPAGDSNVIYVSSSGNDSNAGNSPNAAVRTIARGKSLLRNGSADQLLFKRGDTFTGNFGIWNLSGRSESEPMLIGTYGEGARPLINTGSASGLVGGRDAINHLVIQGLHFNASSRDPDGGSFAGTAGGSYGIQSLAPMNDILIEDVAVENYKFNISIQKFYGDINDVTVRRSVITDAYSEPGGGHSSGLYAYGIHGFTLEDNVFDHNGWLSDKVPSAKQTVFNHNAYLKENLTGVTVTGNIFSNASSHGLQARSGGVVQNNLFLNNPVHMSFGLINGAPPYVGGVSGEVSGNVYLGGRSINNSARGWALEIGNTSKAADTIVKDNIIAHDTQGYFPAISLNYGNNVEQPEGYAGLHNLTLQNNIVYKWYQSLALSSGFQAGGTGLRSLSNLTIADNQFQMTGSARIISHGNGYTAGNENWNGNSYYTNKSPSGWFSIGGNTTSFGTWQSQIDGSASDQPISYDDPDRNPGTYNEELGGEGTLAAFMAEARKQTQGTYRPEYTAAPVVSYIRQGFGLEGSSPVAGPRVTLTASDLGSGDTDQVITVTYRSPAGVDEGSLDSQDLTVTGPNGYSAAAEFLSSTPGTNGAIVAKYRVPAPKGAWDAEDDGTYTVTLNTGQVQDGAGTDFPGRSLGGFNVQYGTPTFPPPPGGVPPAGGEFPPGTEPGAPAPSFPPPPGIDPTPGGAGPTPTPTPTTPTPTPTPTEPVPTPTPTPTDPVPTPTPTPTGTQPTGAFPTGGSPGFAVLEVNAETGVTVGNAATAIDLVDNYDIAAQPGNAADADDADAIMKYGVPQLNLVATRFAQFPTAAQFGHDNIAIVVAGVVDVVSGTSGEFTVGLLSPGAARLFVNGTVAVDLAADDTDGLAEATLTLKDGDTLRVVHAEVDAPQGSEALILYTKNAVTGGTGGGGTGGGGTGAPTPSSGQTVVGAEGSPLAITAPSDPLGPLAGATPGGGTGAPTPTPTPTPTFPGVPPIGPSPANPDGSSTPPPDTRAPIVRQSAYVQMAQADRVELRFTEDVGATLSLEDLVIRDTATGAVVPAAGMKMSYDSSTLTAVVTFPGLTNAELEPGRYTVTLLGSGISDAANNALDGNGDGQGGDNFTMTFDKL